LVAPRNAATIKTNSVSIAEMLNGRERVALKAAKMGNGQRPLRRAHLPGLVAYQSKLGANNTSEVLPFVGLCEQEPSRLRTVSVSKPPAASCLTRARSNVMVKETATTAGFGVAYPLIVTPDDVGLARPDYLDVCAGLYYRSN